MKKVLTLLSVKGAYNRIMLVKLPAINTSTTVSARGIPPSPPPPE